MTDEKRPLKVFILHASADMPEVHELYRVLTQYGLQPWLDAEDLLPGQNLQVVIPKQLEISDAIIICLSKGLVDKEGYVQKEFRFALDKASEIPEDRIFLIPARLEECDIPRLLSTYQWVDLFNEGGYEKLMQSLKLRASQLGRADVQTAKSDESNSSLIEKPKKGISEQGNINNNDKNIIKKENMSPKPPRMMKPDHIFTILGIIATIFAGLVASPLIERWFPTAPSSTPTITVTTNLPTSSQLASPSTLDAIKAPTATWFPTPTLTMTPSQTPTVQICAYQRANDDETIVALIQAEAVAAQNKKMTIIEGIFDSDAIFQDYQGTPAGAVTPSKEWLGAKLRYKELFATIDFKDSKHFDILPVGSGVSGDTATYTSGSDITYRVGSGSWTYQINGSVNTTKYGSEHWILKKNLNGCWIITQMEFNAGHIKFP